MYAGNSISSCGYTIVRDVKLNTAERVWSVEGVQHRCASVVRGITVPLHHLSLYKLPSASTKDTNDRLTLSIYCILDII